MKYLVMTFRTPQFNPAFIEAHYTFLDELRQAGQLECAGPFTDKTGGAYILRADTLEHAKDIAFRDPLHVSLSSKITVYEWNAS